MKKITVSLLALGMIFTAVPANTVCAAETPAVVSAAEASSDALSIYEIAGKWEYQVSSGNYTIDKGSKYNGIVEIKANGTYSYTDTNGKVSTGTVKTGTEEIGGTKLVMVNFYEGGEFSFGGCYDKNTLNTISLGNGGLARLVRCAEAVPEIKQLAGNWKYQVSSGNYTIDKGAKDNGIVEIKADGTYTYTDANGKVSAGTVKTGTEKIGTTEFATVHFYEGSEFSFGGYYRSEPTEISLGNGGIARLVPVTFDFGDTNGDSIIDARDATDVLSYYAKISSGQSDKNYTDAKKKVSDYNKDGIIDARDATEILTYYAKSSAGLL